MNEAWEKPIVEAWWLAIDQPENMLDQLCRVPPPGPLTQNDPAISKSILLHLHLAWRSSLCGEERHTLGRPLAGHMGEQYDKCLATLVNITAKYRPMAAHLLRDIVGDNPYSPLSALRVDWLTPDVRALAQAAYQHPVRWKCQKCIGTGDRHPGTFWHHYDRRTKDDDCLACDGTGGVEDGSLDPARFAVLSDALEEAGCDSEELLRHLRGEEYRPNRSSLEWRPASGPHVRGCWALRAILGGTHDAE